MKFVMWFTTPTPLGKPPNLPMVIKDRRTGKILEEFPDAEKLMIECDGTGEIVICDKSSCLEYAPNE